jgi:hypothetical protein
MDNKRRLINLIEKYLNEIKGDIVIKFYGEGTHIKVNSITFGVTKNYVIIDAIVKLGNIITEDVVDESLAKVLIEDSMVYFFPDSEIRTLVNFDI